MTKQISIHRYKRKRISLIIFLLFSFFFTFTRFASAENSTIPFLVLNFENHDTIKLSSHDGLGSVYWDIDLDGFAEATSWINKENALLVIDKNEDGYISNQAELFGNAAEDGFTALSAYDTDKDKKITPQDNIWNKLYLWFDKNTDGYSQKKELYTLDEYYIKSISLNTSPYPEPLNTNQRITASSVFIFAPENAEPTQSRIYNVLPIFDQVNTVYNQNFTLDMRALFLPTLRGYGQLPDLYIAISEDKKLLERVKDLAIMDTKTFFLPETPVEKQFEEILIQWANAQDIPINSRGPNINAQQLAFLEALTGEPFIQEGAGGTPNPLPYAANKLTSAYKIAFQNVFSSFFIQTRIGKDLFTNKVSYNARLDTIITTTTPELNEVTLKTLTDQATILPPQKALKLWERYIRIINWHQNIEKMSPEDIQKLSLAISTSTPSTFEDILLKLNQTTTVFTPPIPKEPFFKQIDFILLGLLSALFTLLIFRKMSYAQD